MARRHPKTKLNFYVRSIILTVYNIICYDIYFTRIYLTFFKLLLYTLNWDEILVGRKCMTKKKTGKEVYDMFKFCYFYFISLLSRFFDTLFNRLIILSATTSFLRSTFHRRSVDFELNDFFFLLMTTKNKIWDDIHINNY